jgi:hypothetical protein
MNTLNMKAEKIACTRCANYYVTWDKDFPYGCRGFGFKSKADPRHTVRKTSGQECMLFKEKGKETGEDKSK